MKNIKTFELFGNFFSPNPEKVKEKKRVNMLKKMTKVGEILTELTTSGRIDVSDAVSSLYSVVGLLEVLSENIEIIDKRKFDYYLDLSIDLWKQMVEKIGGRRVSKSIHDDIMEMKDVLEEIGRKHGYRKKSYNDDYDDYNAKYNYGYNPKPKQPEPKSNEDPTTQNKRRLYILLKDTLAGYQRTMDRIKEWEKQNPGKTHTDRESTEKEIDAVKTKIKNIKDKYQFEHLKSFEYF